MSKRKKKTEQETPEVESNNIWSHKSKPWCNEWNGRGQMLICPDAKIMYKKNPKAYAGHLPPELRPHTVQA